MKFIFLWSCIAFGLSLIFTPIIKKFASYIGAIDIPKDKRRVHLKPIPLLGGLAIYLSFMLTVIIKAGNISLAETGILLGSTIIVIGGFLDDKFDLKPWQKLLFQSAATVCLILFGVKIQLITNPLFDSQQYINIGMLGIPLTFFWIIGITNAINLIDGLDGLAAGVAFIASATLFFVCILNYRTDAAYLTAILCGSILGFLPYNFNPAQIFMGDTGAQLLGFLLASISIEGAIKSAAAFAIAVPILALGLPIYDTLFAMIRRKLNGKPIMQADRGHLHHRLLDMGLTQRQTVIIMYLISAVLGAFAILAMRVSPQRSYFILAIIMILLVLIAWKCGFFKHKE